MRRLVLPLLLLAACGSEEEKPAEKSWSWSVPDAEAQHATSVALLPNGEIFVGVAGPSAEAVFLSQSGEELATFDIGALCDRCVGVSPAKPLLGSDRAIVGDVIADGPLFRVEPEARKLRQLVVDNPLGLEVGGMVFDARRAAAIGPTQFLVPGNSLLQISIEGVVSGTAPTGRVRAVANVAADLYAFIDGDGDLATWRPSDNVIEERSVKAQQLAGAAPLTVVTVEVEGGVQLYRIADRLEPLGPVFANEVELAVAPDAGRIVVGVAADPATEGPVVEDAPSPGTVLVLDANGSTVAKVESPAPVRGLEISADGRFLLVAHDQGVATFTLR